MKAILPRLFVSIFVVCLFGSNQTYAQDSLLAHKEGVSYEEMQAHLRQLNENKDDHSLEQLKAEVDALAKSPREELVTIAISVYSQILDKEEKADSIQQAMIEKYPVGLFAASQPYDSLFQQEASAHVLEEGYRAFNEKFDISSFYPLFQPKFLEGQLIILHKYIEEGNLDKAVALAPELKGGPFFVHGISLLYQEMEDESKYETLLPMAREAYVDTERLSRVSSPIQKLYQQNVKKIASIYGDLLYHIGDYQQASGIASELLSETDYESATVLTDVRTLAGSYLKLNRKKDALTVYGNFLEKHGDKENIAEEVKELYAELHPDGDFESYLSQLEEQVKTARFAQYTEKMIKEEAPVFTLVDREGVEVSLSDYRGKVVVVDFWATWCGPCVSSFPGMHAAVNKYESDADVVFLFIDTWERAENYKELVEEFIVENEYSFHVLFDEMKDREKAVVTAYGVTGIPTKFVIDKEGFIRFKSVGSSSYQVDDIVTEMETMITLAKGE